METFAKAILEYPPAWAGGWGEDRLGTFADLAYGRTVFRFRWIPPGMFWMGSPDEETGRYPDEGPRHRVRISRGFWLAETPCTQAQWQAVMGENPSHFSQGESGKRPVENVSWMMANEFCGKLTGAAREPGALEGRDVFRLPTEAEWEYACRAGTESAFNDGSDCTVPGGNDPALERLGWFDKNSGDETHEVRRKAANAWGLYDLHGNVWEWCLDGRRTYQDEAEIVPNPIGLTDSGARRVLRGGSFWSLARFCRSAYRYESDPGYRHGYIGFRFAAGQPPEAGTGASGASRGRSEG